MSASSPPASFEELRVSTLDELKRMHRDLAAKQRRVDTQSRQVEKLEERLAAIKGDLTLARRTRSEVQAEYDAHAAEIRSKRLWLTLVNEKLGYPDEDPFPKSEAGADDAGGTASSASEQQAPPASGLSLDVAAS